jgi:nucleoside-diphosphate-sugar epimerase
MEIVIVTGSSGFIGRSVIRRLAQDFRNSSAPQPHEEGDVGSRRCDVRPCSPRSHTLATVETIRT